MDPTPDTPFSQVGPEWALVVHCRCRIRDFIRAYRERHFAPNMTAARFCARGKCQHCGGPVIAAAWESAVVGQGGLADGARRVKVR